MTTARRYNFVASSILRDIELSEYIEEDESVEPQDNTEIVKLLSIPGGRGAYGWNSGDQTYWQGVIRG